MNEATNAIVTVYIAGALVLIGILVLGILAKNKKHHD